MIGEGGRGLHRDARSASRSALVQRPRGRRHSRGGPKITFSRRHGGISYRPPPPAPPPRKKSNEGVHRQHQPGCAITQRDQGFRSGAQGPDEGVTRRIRSLAAPAQRAHSRAAARASSKFGGEISRAGRQQHSVRQRGKRKSHPGTHVAPAMRSTTIFATAQAVGCSSTRALSRGAYISACRCCAQARAVR